MGVWRAGIAIGRAGVATWTRRIAIWRGGAAVGRRGVAIRGPGAGVWRAGVGVWRPGAAIGPGGMAIRNAGIGARREWMANPAWGIAVCPFETTCDRVACSLAGECSSHRADERVFTEVLGNFPPCSGKRGAGSSRVLGAGCWGAGAPLAVSECTSRPAGRWPYNPCCARAAARWYWARKWSESSLASCTSAMRLPELRVVLMRPPAAA